MSASGPSERREPRSVAADSTSRASRLAPLPRLPIAAIGLACLALLAGGCTRMLEVNDPCETFVHRDTPPLSPVVRRAADGSLEVLVEVTAIAEAQAVVAAARKEPIDVILYPSEKFVHVLRVEGDKLVVLAKSPEHADHVRDALCIEPGDP
jgi:hypothetical protein